MTGQFLINKSLPKEMKYINACLHFENQVLLFHDTRKFGTFELVTKKTNILPHLGLEPLQKEFTSKALHQMLQSSKRNLNIIMKELDFILKNI